MSEFISNPEEVKEFLPKYRFFYLALFITFVTFVSRLWYLQVLEGSTLRSFSEKNRIKQNKVNAPRGLVFDRNGKILVENQQGYDAILSPQYIQKLEEVAAVVAPILGMEPDKLVQKVLKSKKQNGPFVPVVVKDNLSREEVFRLKRIRLETQGLEIKESVVRFYPLRNNSSQLFGYVGEISKKQIPNYNKKFSDLGLTFEQGDIVGQNGLEENLESDLRGESGIEFLQVDAFGREARTQTPNIYGEKIKDQDSVPGKNVILTLDRDIQDVAYKVFSEQQRTGGVVAMKSNGEVIAWVSTPAFDPNDFSRGITPQLWGTLINDPDKPLRNKVIQDHYSPGSTFKAFMAMAALQEKTISDTTVVNCPGTIMFGRRPYHDNYKPGFGNITVYDAIERSSNVFFYKLGIQLGIDKMYNYISLLGLGAPTGIELKRETSGTMPSAEWKKKNIGEEWQPGENLSTAIGQGFVQVTPLQMAVAYNAIGTEGQVVKPFIIKKVVDTDGKVIQENFPKVVRDLSQVQANGIKIDNKTFKIVKEALRRVIQGDRGTARALRVPGIEIAGKTGTTQVMGFAANDIYTKCENRPRHQRHHGWFVGFAPADKPEIVVAALAEHSCHGASGAGPVVKEIFKTYFEKYHPEMMAEALKNSKIKSAVVKPDIPIEGE